jgi:hypothetical protein
MNDKETGGPAFPVAAEFYSDGGYRSHSYSGMTLRQYAAIKLKVADSGVAWLDKMITKSMRDDIAAKAMQAYLCGSDRDNFTYAEWTGWSYQMADAMLAAEIGRSMR